MFMLILYFDETRRVDHIRSQKKSTRKTKVICTLGPACWSVEGLGGLIGDTLLI